MTKFDIKIKRVEVELKKYKSIKRMIQNKTKQNKTNIN